jgi:hypothetical protein
VYGLKIELYYYVGSRVRYDDTQYLYNVCGYRYVCIGMID